MRIKSLAKEYKEIIFYNHHVNGIKNNSLDIKENDVFVAIKGYSDDGHKYIKEAINKGAKTIIYEDDVIKISGINYILVDDCKKYLGVIANRFFKEVTKKIYMIGITGTNGKTTISTLISSFLDYSGISNILIGTNGIKFNDCNYTTNNTTPDILLCLNAIYEAYKKGAKYCIMEVSSHAIKELRVYGFNYKMGIFSNITHDHLDYHKSMTDYMYIKAHFLSHVKDVVILNKDISEYSFFSKLIETKIISYSINNNSDFKASNIIKSFENGTTFKVLTKEYKKTIHTPLIGKFNVYNILAAMTAITYLKFNIDDFSRFLKFYVKISGRMEMLKMNNRCFIIDYAHTPDGVLNVCLNIREYTNNKLKIVIGCGGNRDKEKRPLIGEIVTKYADYVIFTNDNPRNENEEEIIRDILSGVSTNNYDVILNRQKAIYQIIKDSEPNDCIAILGKGNETYQIINGIKYPFNDIECIKKIMKRVFL